MRGSLFVSERMNHLAEKRVFLRLGQIKKNMIVMKFGGSSVGSADSIIKVSKIVQKYSSKQLVVVVSAMFGVTDMLILAAEIAKNGDHSGLMKVMGLVSEKHNTAIGRLELKLDVQPILNECLDLLKGIAYLKEISPRSTDLILSFGERLSAPIVAASIRKMGLSSESVDARKLIRTDGKFSAAKVKFDETNLLLDAELRPLINAGTIPVVTGFIASTVQGETTTIGRGGSDYTASIIGAGLGAEEVWIWKEVDGVLTADPRVVCEAQKLDKISYDEAAEMSHFGAKVLHPMTMIPVAGANIPIRIKNTFSPEKVGTLISRETDRTLGGVKAVSAIKDLCMVSLEGKGMAGIAGFAAHLFAVAGRLKINILMFTQSSSEQIICLVVSKKEGQELQKELESELKEDVMTNLIEAVKVEDNISAVAVVGDGMKGRLGVAANVFSSIADKGINILAIAQGSSERNISFIVREKDADKAVRAIHSAFKLETIRNNVKKICA